MSERLVDSFSQISTLADLRELIPASVSAQLGGGEEGTELYLYLVLTLSGFAPEPVPFDRRAFNSLVAVDFETQAPFLKELGNKMLEVALQTGLMKEVTGEPDVYMANPVLRPLAEKVFR